MFHDSSRNYNEENIVDNNFIHFLMYGAVIQVAISFRIDYNLWMKYHNLYKKSCTHVRHI